ncbi:MAG: hypothetical protein KAY24_12585 [Candidatus Eisenbacteria sp.]|nr:hypothetical protein [Candidatus Eisenbacteria bacterium]
MKKQDRFNPSLITPLLNVTAGIIVILTAGFIWFQASGQARIDLAYTQLREASETNDAELGGIQATWAAAQKELAASKTERVSKGEYLEFLRYRIEAEQRALMETWEQQRPYREKAAQLQAEIQRCDDYRRAYKTDIFETGRKIQTARAEIVVLEAEIDQLRGGSYKTPVVALSANAEQSQDRKLCNHPLNRIFDPTTRQDLSR